MVFHGIFSKWAQRALANCNLKFVLKRILRNIYDVFLCNWLVLQDICHFILVIARYT